MSVELIRTFMKPFASRFRKYNLYLCGCGEKFEYESASAKKRDIQKCKKCHFKKYLCKQRPREYRSWQHMKDRCYNTNHKRYRDWGGRGITVCKRWLESFENFFTDMGEKPRGDEWYTLDRIDNNGNYNKKNCRWATPTEQRSNRRTQEQILIDRGEYDKYFSDLANHIWDL